MGVVHEPVEDRVGVGWVADPLMPGRDGQLAGDDGGATAIAIPEDFEEIVAGLVVERFEPPVVEDQQLDAGKRVREPRLAAVAAGEREIGEQA